MFLAYDFFRFLRRPPQDHTEILQTLQERYAGGHGQLPAGSASAAKNGRRKPVEAFSGVGRPFPPSAPGFVRPGRSWTAWARCPALGLHRHSWRCELERRRPSSPEVAKLASSSAWSALPPFPLGVQPAAVTPALAFEVGHGLGKPLFLAKPGFSWLSSCCGAR